MGTLIRYFFNSGAEKELEGRQALFTNQLLAIFILFIAGIVVYFTEKIYPDFFDYPYLNLRVDYQNIARFWPLFVYATIMAYISSIELVSTRLDAKILGWSVITSILAGIWEELGYRWLFICTAMITIVVMNWAFSTFLGPLLAVLIVIGGFSLLSKGKNILGTLSGLLAVLLGLWLIWISFQGNPIFWLYENVTVPIANFVTFYHFENVFYSTEYPKLFIWGMVSANASFRDGHKYQGLVGVINAWIVGFILMGAMLNYGLMTAVVIHAAYDLEFAFIRYIFRKIDIL